MSKQPSTINGVWFWLLFFSFMTNAFLLGWLLK